MPITSLHAPTHRWLTRCSSTDFVPGSEHTLSIGHPLLGGEFTTHRLGGAVAHDDAGNALFDLGEAEIKMEWGAGFYPAAALRTIREDRPSPGFILGGRRYRVTGFGHYAPENDRDKTAWRALRDYDAEEARRLIAKSVATGLAVSLEETYEPDPVMATIGHRCAMRIIALEA